MTAHKHAALMLQYAEDATKTDTPWERWEFKLHGGPWFGCENHPTWSENIRYRRKPQVINVGRHEFPKPITNELVAGLKYFYVKIGKTCFEAAEAFWADNGQDLMRLKSKRIHLTSEAAQAHADVLNAICRGDVE